MIVKMSKQQPISVPIDPETIAEVDELAARLDCTREALVDAAIHRFMDEQDSRPAHARLGFESQGELDAYLKPGLEDIAAGETVPAEQVMAMLDKWIADFRKQCG